jgi:hypothetical protein
MGYLKQRKAAAPVAAVGAEGNYQMEAKQQPYVAQQQTYPPQPVQQQQVPQGQMYQQPVPQYQQQQVVDGYQAPPPQGQMYQQPPQ